MGTGQPNVNGTALSQFKLPLPPLEEQKCISRQGRPTHDPVRRTRSETQPGTAAQRKTDGSHRSVAFGGVILLSFSLLGHNSYFLNAIVYEREN